MKNKNYLGFSLIEVMTAVIIMSMVAIAFFTVLARVNKQEYYQRVDHCPDEQADAIMALLLGDYVRPVLLAEEFGLLGGQALADRLKSVQGILSSHQRCLDEQRCDTDGGGVGRASSDDLGDDCHTGLSLLAIGPRVAGRCCAMFFAFADSCARSGPADQSGAIILLPGEVQSSSPCIVAGTAEMTKAGVGRRGTL